MSLKVLFLILIFKSYDILSVNAECIIAFKDLIRENQPAYIDPITNRLFYPIWYGSKPAFVFQLAENQHLKLWCSEGFENIPDGLKSITIKCEGGAITYNTLRFNNINSFECKGWSNATYKNTGKACYGSGTLIDVGFQIDNVWQNIYTVCFDAIQEKTYYAHYNLSGVSPQIGVEEPSWEQKCFFPGKTVDYLYKIDKQKETISTIFKDDNAGQHFINASKTEKQFLSRGHIAAKTEFDLALHQRSTYHFVNIAPQWQSINDGNWNAVEVWSKNAARTRKGLEIYTGTFDILNLNYNSVNKRIFLDYTPDCSEKLGFFARVIRRLWFGNKKLCQIPAPQFYYKIVLKFAKTNFGVVFISYNNPIMLETEANCDAICPNQNSKMNFNGKNNYGNPKLGIICTCLVKDFLNAVPHVNLGNAKFELMVTK